MTGAKFGKLAKVGKVIVGHLIQNIMMDAIHSILEAMQRFHTIESEVCCKNPFASRASPSHVPWLVPDQSRAQTMQTLLKNCLRKSHPSLRHTRSLAPCPGLHEEERIRHQSTGSPLPAGLSGLQQDRGCSVDTVPPQNPRARRCDTLPELQIQPV